MPNKEFISADEVCLSSSSPYCSRISDMSLQECFDLLTKDAKNIFAEENLSDGEILSKVQIEFDTRSDVYSGSEVYAVYTLSLTRPTTEKEKAEYTKRGKLVKKREEERELRMYETLKKKFEKESV
jgi:hypothetical protein